MEALTTSKSKQLNCFNKEIYICSRASGNQFLEKKKVFDIESIFYMSWKRWLLFIFSQIQLNLLQNTPVQRRLTKLFLPEMQQWENPVSLPDFARMNFEAIPVQPWVQLFFLLKYWSEFHCCSAEMGEKTTLCFCLLGISEYTCAVS